MVSEVAVEQDFTAKGTSGNLTAKESWVKAKTWEICFNERITGEMGYIDDIVEDRIQNAILTQIIGIVLQRLN